MTVEKVPEAESDGRPLRPEILSGLQKRTLRAQAHDLKPIVMVGKHGISGTVVEAVSEALDRHELIKVSIPSEGRQERREMAALISAPTGSHIIQTIGHVVVLFRQRTHDSNFKLR